jgi:hypothetical protein
MAYNTIFIKTTLLTFDIPYASINENKGIEYLSKKTN